MNEGLENGKKVYFVSLGCPKNRVDSEVMLGDLAARDYEMVQSADEADVLVVNTCSFVEEAREESVDTILELAHEKTESADSKRLVVTGCLAQRYQEDLRSEIPEVDILLGTGDHWRIGSLLDGDGLPQVKGASPAIDMDGAMSVVGKPGHNYAAYMPRFRTTPAWTAYVKIAEGCSQRCAFCIIPRLRGGQKSRTIEERYFMRYLPLVGKFTFLSSD